MDKTQLKQVIADALATSPDLAQSMGQGDEVQLRIRKWPGGIIELDFEMSTRFSIKDGEARELLNKIYVR